jgi:F0F1-type ATP synthase assembly protein I
MPTDAPPILTPTPSPIRLSIIAISAITALSALPWILIAATEFKSFAWGLFGFEFILLLGCLMTIWVALNKKTVGSTMPMAIVCLIGTILVGAVFGIHVDARAIVGEDPTIGPWINRTRDFRLLVIIAFSMLAVLDVYRRDARSWGLVLRAVIFLLPIVAILGWIKLKGMPSVNDSSGELSPMRMVVFLLSGLGIGILFSIGGHFLIRSFEIALPEPQPAPSPENKPK